MTTLFQSQLHSHPILWPFAFAFFVYGVRYLITAVLAYVIARPVNGRWWGRAHADTPATFNFKLHLRRELFYSFWTVVIFGLVNAALFGWGLMGSSLMYFKHTHYPAWWFWLSIPVMLVLHDTFFYWLHRAMHLPVLFKTMHRVHHLSIYPTAFAAYSFHPTEALAEALIVTAIIFIIPVHPFAFLIFQTISTAYNVYGHCGREFYPVGMEKHWLGRWINTSTAHAYHHLKAKGNYGLYFLFWDRIMHTYAPVARKV
jgi:Delta7-sterol 5-desaturase